MVSGPGSIAQRAVAPSSRAWETSVDGELAALPGTSSRADPTSSVSLISSLSLSGCSFLSYQMSFGTSVQTPAGRLSWVLAPTGSPSPNL